MLPLHHNPVWLEGVEPSLVVSKTTRLSVSLQPSLIVGIRTQNGSFVDFRDLRFTTTKWVELESNQPRGVLQTPALPLELPTQVRSAGFEPALAR